MLLDNVIEDMFIAPLDSDRKAKRDTTALATGPSSMSEIGSQTNDNTIFFLNICLHFLQPKLAVEVFHTEFHQPPRVARRFPFS